MSVKSKSIQQKHSHVLLIAGVTAALLLIPLLAMQLSDEWDWKLSDFVIVGVLLFGTGYLYDYFARKTKSTQRRLLIGAGLFVLLALVWAELAVGLFGGPFAGA